MSAFTDALDDFVEAWNAAFATDPPNRDQVAALGEKLQTALLAMSFLDLVDTPDDYTDHGGDLVIATETEDGVEFQPPA